MQLRPYQEAALEGLNEKFQSGKRSVILWAPTGAGKTVMAGSLIRSSIRNSRFVLFLAHRKELIDQCAKKLEALDVPFGVIMAGCQADSTAPVQVASIQTLIRRELPFQPDLIVIDECHHAAAATYRKVIDAAPEALVVGLTATPFRADGRGLGEIFQDWVTASTVSKLTEMGYLAPARYWAPTIPDLAGIGKKGADWDPSQLGERMSKPKLVGDVVKHYQKLVDGRKAICFCVTKEHSQAMANAFNQAGILAAHLGDDTPKRERENVLADHMAGKLRILTNVNILSEGYDSPSVEVCIQARPTMSLGMHLQQIGRVLRPHANKNNAYVIDHAGNCRRHGLATDPLDVDLSTEKAVKRSQTDAPALRTCKECYAILPASVKVCPNCEKELGNAPKTIINKDGTLQELTKQVCKCGSYTTKKEPHPIYGYGLYCAECGAWFKWLGQETNPKEYYLKKAKIAEEKGYKMGWAAMQFKVRFDRWPTPSEMRA